MTHTPGPWLINFDQEDDERPLEIVTSDRDHRIAFLASDGNPGDARLIAAAPDLLAAMKDALSLTGGWREAIVELEDFCSEPVRLKNMIAAADQLDRFAATARAIVAKIEGQS
jgi:hypothetical protein